MIGRWRRGVATVARCEVLELECGTDGGTVGGGVPGSLVGVLSDRYRKEHTPWERIAHSSRIEAATASTAEGSPPAAGGPDRVGGRCDGGAGGAEVGGARCRWARRAGGGPNRSRRRQGRGLGGDDPGRRAGPRRVLHHHRGPRRRPGRVRRAAERSAGSDTPCLRTDGWRRGRGPFERHRGGPAACQLRGSARDGPERQRRGRVARRRAPLLGLVVEPARGGLPGGGGHGVRAGADGRRGPADGRPGRRRRVVHREPDHRLPDGDGRRRGSRAGRRARRGQRHRRPLRLAFGGVDRPRRVPDRRAAGGAVGGGEPAATPRGRAPGRRVGHRRARRCCGCCSPGRSRRCSRCLRRLDLVRGSSWKSATCRACCGRSPRWGWPRCGSRPRSTSHRSASRPTRSTGIPAWSTWPGTCTSTSPPPCGTGLPARSSPPR